MEKIPSHQSYFLASLKVPKRAPRKNLIREMRKILREVQDPKKLFEYASALRKNEIISSYQNHLNISEHEHEYVSTITYRKRAFSEP